MEEIDKKNVIDTMEIIAIQPKNLQRQVSYKRLFWSLFFLIITSASIMGLIYGIAALRNSALI